MINSVSEYKEFLEIDISNPSEDELIEDYALEVEDWVKEYIGRDLEASAYVEKYDGDGSKFLVTEQFPINSVAYIKYYDGLDGSNEEVWTAYTLGDHYARLVITNGCKIYLDGGIFVRGTQNIEVSYNAGYSSSTMPKEIKKGCKELLSLYWNEFKSARTLGIGNVTKSGVGVNDTLTFDKEEVNRVLKHLDKYRSINL